jgi:molecular chaperone DnaK
MEPIVGIDLGTTNSVVAYVKDGRPVVIPNAEGDPLTPSVVAFAADGRQWVGRLARAQAVANPLRTFFSVKRRIGRGADGPAAIVSSIKRHMGLDCDVEINGHHYSPVEISAMILGKLKADTERRLGCPIRPAVITVPAYFNDAQRRATEQAGTLAGLEVVRLVNEPTAAAMAYGLDMENAHTVLVWDLGGGTFDVSVLELGDGVFQVKAVNGDTQLGGDDYDARIAEILVAEFRLQWGVELGDGPVAGRLMRMLAEEAKIRLSTAAEARVTLPEPFGRGTSPRGLPGRGRCAVTITREAFESATADITERMARPARQVLADAGLDALDLDRVILVGGMTRVPAVRRLVKEITGLEPYAHIDPDEVVALGAAVQAGVLAGQLRNVTLVDVTPLSLGIKTQGGLFARIIPRNAPIPASGSRLFTNACDDQTQMDIHVLQGERELAEENMTLGRFELTGITSQPRGQAKVEVVFDIDANGMVQVSAIDLQTEVASRIRIHAADRPGQEAVEQMLVESRRRLDADRHKREEIEAGIYADNLLRAAGLCLADIDPDVGGPARAAAIDDVERGVSAVQAALADGQLDAMKQASTLLERCLKSLSRSAAGLTPRAARTST